MFDLSNLIKSKKGYREKLCFWLNFLNVFYQLFLKFFIERENKS